MKEIYFLALYQKIVDKIIIYEETSMHRRELCEDVIDIIVEELGFEIKDGKIIKKK